MDLEERPSKIQKLSHHDSQGITSEETNHHEDTSTKSARHDVNGLESAQAQTTEQNDDGAGESSGSTTIDQDSRKDVPSDNIQGEAESKPLSKSQQKKLLKKQRWEEGRAARKVKRKEKLVEKRERKRAAKDAQTPDADSGLSKSDVKAQNHDRNKQQSVLLPVTIILDCGFDDLMNENEKISLGSQITRCYSDNKNSSLRAHLVVSSWGGYLKDRFDNLLQRHHKSWKGVRWLQGDFVEASERAKEWMTGEKGGELDGALLKHGSEETSIEALKAQGEVVYLTSESDNTLNELKPYSTYIIGGLVDKNRHKGICYKRAMDRGVKTARLPIGDFMTMNSRKVLTTNHVSEIMVKWLVSGDWGEAFLQVMPKRKGGQLKEQEIPNKIQADDHESDDAGLCESVQQTENVDSAGEQEAIIAAETPEAGEADSPEKDQQ